MSVIVPILRPPLQTILRSVFDVGAGGGGGPKPVDLFVVVGQSNAEGRGDSALSPAAPTGLYISGSTIGPLADPVGGATTGSMWPAFANEWHARTGRRAAFVEAALGGSGLLTGAGGQWSPSGTLRGIAVTAANAARAALGANPEAYPPGNVYFLWCQGENDASFINGTTVTGALYEQALKDLAAYFKAQVPAMAQMAVVMTGAEAAANGSVEVMDQLDLGHQEIRAAQERACATDDNLTMAYRGAFAFPTTGMQKDALHFNQSGLNLAGKCAARQLAEPTEPAAIDPLISTVNYVDSTTVNKTVRTVSHTTPAGTELLVVAVASQRIGSATVFTTAATFGGVAMRPIGWARSSSASPATSAHACLFAIDAAAYGASLAGVTADIVVTAVQAQTVMDICAINAKDAALPDAEAGFFPAGTAADNGTVSLTTFYPALVVTVGSSAANSAAPLTGALTGSTKVLDHSLSNGTRSGQALVGYSVEAAPVQDKTITATWSAPCTQLAIYTVAFRRKVPGE